MVYTALSWRRKGLGRWALSRLLELAHLDWLQQRRCACAHVHMWRVILVHVILGACHVQLRRCPGMVTARVSARTCGPFIVVPDADHVMRNMISQFGLARSSALYQLQVGSDSMMGVSSICMLLICPAQTRLSKCLDGT